MVDLHERLSEFSYGYAATKEAELLLETVGLTAVPFLPSLLHEAELGFDVSFKLKGRLLLLQFKLGEELRMFRPKPAPILSRPYWRYRIDTLGHQFVRLSSFESTGAEVYYVAPRFSNWDDFEIAYKSKQVLESSLLMRPSEINRGLTAVGANPGRHKIAYDKERRYVCSRPSSLEEETPDHLAARMAADIRASESNLGEQLQRLYDRPRPAREPRRSELSGIPLVFERARSREDALAAVVGMEAWAAGAQPIFVTLPSA